MIGVHRVLHTGMSEPHVPTAAAVDTATRALLDATDDLPDDVEAGVRAAIAALVDQGHYVEHPLACFQ